MPIQRDAYFKIFQNYLEYIYVQVVVYFSNYTYEITSEKPLGASKIVIIFVTITDQIGHSLMYLDF
ncbi:hypothetical protein [Candidatus Gullanella endobia]|uniref:hypothetical protein n=1 Tax=Candidatus Gullanella endobia TaxID=1070130 RepID=UPI0013150F0C|nr:hypothetical protein [Candidatus Gullanella endobia]